jgi:hypothetical protein
MDLLDKAIENPHPMAACQQGPAEMAADETGTAGDQDMIGHVQTPGPVVAVDMTGTRWAGRIDPTVNRRGDRRMPT